MNHVDLLFKEEVYRIIGATIEVHSELGPGFLEAVYHEALEIVFTEKGIPFKSHEKLSIPFRGRILKKKHEADFVCFEEIVVDIKAATRLISDDDAVMLNYLRTTRKRLGILINFGSTKKLEWKRLIS